MKRNNRRTFLQQSSALSLAAFLPLSLNDTKRERKFKMCLNAGTIGVDVNQLEVLKLAERYGFETMTVHLNEMTKMDATERTDFVAQMQEKGISWGSTNLPIEFRSDETTFKKGLDELPRKVAVLEQIGGTRMNTWIMPTHKSLTYLENFQQHQERLQEVANVLGHYDIRLGLEYVGPKTLMTRDRYAFIHTMKELKELLSAIDESNVGFVLDSFHWFTAEESVADLLTLDKEDIVTCDLNDAQAGLTAAQQIDNQRELPMASGVIDLKGFLGALTQIGYEGPIRAEPFNAKLDEMDNESAIQATKTALQKAFDLV